MLEEEYVTQKELGTKTKNKFQNQNKKVNALIIILCSLFVIFLLFVGLDIIGAVSLGHILNYYPRLHIKLQSIMVLEQKQQFLTIYNGENDIEEKHMGETYGLINQIDGPAKNQIQLSDTILVETDNQKDYGNSLVGQTNKRQIESSLDESISDKQNKIQERSGIKTQDLSSLPFIENLLQQHFQY